MPVLKQRHTKDFTVVPNDLLRNRKISLRDIGLLVWMLSKPHDWKFTYDGMLSELGTDGKAALQKSVKALQTAGYIKIEKTRRKGKLSESIWYVYDSPHIENQYMVNQPQMQNAAISISQLTEITFEITDKHQVTLKRCFDQCFSQVNRI